MRFSKEEKAMWLEDWRQSGKKAWAYARENGLIPQTFVGWTKKRSKSKSSFVEIQTQTLPTLQVTMILVEKGELKVHIPVGLGCKELRSVIEGLVVAL